MKGTPGSALGGLFLVVLALVFLFGVMSAVAVENKVRARVLWDCQRICGAAEEPRLTVEGIGRQRECVCIPSGRHTPL